MSLINYKLIVLPIISVSAAKSAQFFAFIREKMIKSFSFGLLEIYLETSDAKNRFGHP